jgi:hypothetical protein
MDDDVLDCVGRLIVFGLRLGIAIPRRRCWPSFDVLLENVQGQIEARRLASTANRHLAESRGLHQIEETDGVLAQRVVVRVTDRLLVVLVPVHGNVDRRHSRHLLMICPLQHGAVRRRRVDDLAEHLLLLSRIAGHQPRSVRQLQPVLASRDDPPEPIRGQLAGVEELLVHRRLSLCGGGTGRLRLEVANDVAYVVRSRFEG